MHMSDALISPAVGGVMWGVSLGLAAYSAKKLQSQHTESKVALMGIMGAFVFAAQMINFSIPLTGSSGHLGGGLLLAALLGPWAGFLTMFSILLLQSLLFADGGLLALGCNVFNLGFLTCFLAWPLLYRPLAKDAKSTKRVVWGSVVAAIVALQAGAFSVVVETVLSGRTALPFGAFALVMQPIHLAIGVVEGLITAAIIIFVQKSSPSLLFSSVQKPVMAIRPRASSRPRTLLVLSGLVVLVATGFSVFASSDPDGLEWAVQKVSGDAVLAVSEPIHQALAVFQQTVAPMPDYSLAAAGPQMTTSMAGLVGSFVVAVFVIGIGIFLRLLSRSKAKAKA